MAGRSFSWFEIWGAVEARGGIGHAEIRGNVSLKCCSRGMQEKTGTSISVKSSSIEVGGNHSCGGLLGVSIFLSPHIALSLL